MKIKSQRRHDAQRDRTKAYRLSKLLFPDASEAFRQRWTRHMEQNRKSCSCEMCKNARRSGWLKGNGRLTLNEQRQYDDSIEQLKALQFRFAPNFATD